MQPKKLICIGGLTDGLLACPWVPELSKLAGDCNWSTTQPLLTSSYTGYGTGSLSRDTEELSSFILQLKNKFNTQDIVIVGHSTGCQNACHFTANGDAEAVALVSGIALQAAVSDQEAGLLEPSASNYLQFAREQPTDKLDSLMPIEAHWTPISVRRFLSLFEKYGDDDYFSSYLTDSELSSKLAHFDGLPNLKGVILAYSMADQYVPLDIDKNSLVDRIAKAIGDKCIPLKLQYADHSLSLPQDGSAIKIFVNTVLSLLT